MKDKGKLLGLAVVIAAIVFSFPACGGGKVVNNAEELKAYLDSLPANTPDKPIKVIMNAKDLVFPKISAAITSSGKYVSLNLSGSPLTAIPDDAFFDRNTGCEMLVGIILPKSVTSIGKSAFAGCTSPKSITSIGKSAFFRCTSPKSITIPDSVTSIGDGAFSRCIGLTSVTIPDSVTSIGDSAFNWCTGLTSVTIPNSVTSIGSYARNPTSVGNLTGLSTITNVFSYCTRLTAINVDSGNSAYSSQDGVLFNKDKTELIRYPEGKAGEYIIPNSVTTIGGNAFYNCTSLTGVTIPDSVTSIGDFVFSFCKCLTGITIPKSVTKIGENVFMSCDNLTSITFQGIIPSRNLGSWRGKNHYVAFAFDLHRKYLAGGIGTYTTTAPAGDSSVWKKVTQR
jgi:hypothetical protein